MKRYCRYISILNLQWKYCFKELILIIAGMAAAQLLLLYRTIEKTVSQFVPGAVLTELDEALGAKNLQGIRFEDLMDKSYWAIIFGAALMLVVGLIYAAPIRQRRGAAAQPPPPFFCIKKNHSPDEWFKRVLQRSCKGKNSLC